jgi:peptide/nickel transport system permease protein
MLGAFRWDSHACCVVAGTEISMNRRIIRTLFVAVAVTAVFIGLALRVSFPTSDLQHASLSPRQAHFLGTTPDGRDLLFVCLVAMLRAIGESLWATALTIFAGTFIGAVAAKTVGGVFDRIQSSVGKLLDCVGPFLLAACLASIAPQVSSWKLAIFLALVAWPTVSVVVRSEALAISQLTYVEAARAVGVKPFTLAVNHYLPAMADRLSPLCFGIFGGFVALYGALGFIGVGVSSQQGLGFLLFDAQSFIRTAPWYWTSCFGAFVLLLLLAAGLVRATKRLSVGRDRPFNGLATPETMRLR